MIHYRNASPERGDVRNYFGYNSYRDNSSDSEDSYTDEELLTYAQKGHYFNESGLLEKVLMGECNALYTIAQKHGLKRKAIKWYLKAAEKGHADAQVKMAGYYLNTATQKDPKKALDWYLKAESNGRKDVLLQIASIYRNLTDTDQHNQIAMQWYLKAYEADDTDAAFEIGTMYEKGEGVDHQDYVQAMEWYMKADKREPAKVAISVANLYKNGYGVKKDLDAAERWYKKAYLRGDKSAASEVAKFYDPAGCAWWYRAAYSDDRDHDVYIKLKKLKDINNLENIESIEEEISQSKVNRLAELQNNGYHVAITDKDVEKMKSEYENEIQRLIDTIKELEQRQ